MSSEAGHIPAQTPLRQLNPSKPPPVIQQPRCPAQHWRAQIALVESCVPRLDGSNQTVEYDIIFFAALYLNSSFYKYEKIYAWNTHITSLTYIVMLYWNIIKKEKKYLGDIA